MISGKGDKKPTATQLKNMADKLRVHSIRETTAAGSGHPTSCMSCAEVMSVLFFSRMEKGDEFILSKGHAAPILWAAYAESGLIPRKKLMTLRKITSDLEGHPTRNMKDIRIATGSLGQGLSSGVGMALALGIRKSHNKVYVLLGDGECAEGSVWEAANSASYYGLGNLCAIVDANRLGQSQATMHGHSVASYAKKFRAFGWKTITVDGHSIRQLEKAFASAGKSKRPTAIIAKTFKGNGVSFLKDREGHHGKPLSPEDADKAIKELDAPKITLPSRIGHSRWIIPKITPPALTHYEKGRMVATRNAFGEALYRLGKKNKSIVTIDGDVRNSTKTDRFFDSFPDRSFESFIAEQNMVGMAMGMSAMGFVPFAATFAAFFTRAHDFIRMAQYSNVGINLVGSHTGVSIGEDGPSQMGLEDIPMFISLQGSIVLSPSDAVSAEKLTAEMARRRGINYLRTIREKTPVIYGNDERFRIGGLKVLKRSSSDKILVIASGITVHEALKAYVTLKKQGISIRIIDLYSIKPMDSAGIRRNAAGCRNNVIVVEDHYEGAIGPLVASIIGPIHHLCIRERPRSGPPEKLKRRYCIDSSAIARQVKRILKRR